MDMSRRDLIKAVGAGVAMMATARGAQVLAQQAPAAAAVWPGFGEASAASAEASASAIESSRQSASRLIGTQVSVLMARQPGLLWIAAK